MSSKRNRVTRLRQSRANGIAIKLLQERQRQGRVVARALAPKEFKTWSSFAQSFSSRNPALYEQVYEQVD